MGTVLSQQNALVMPTVSLKCERYIWLQDSFAARSLPTPGATTNHFPPTPLLFQSHSNYFLKESRGHRIILKDSNWKRFVWFGERVSGEEEQL